MADPIPVVSAGGGVVADAPSGAIPLAIYQDAAAVDPVVAALIAAGFGAAGQVLATNATADGFEWIDLPA